MDFRDKRERAEVFRTRLAEAMTDRGLTQSALARRVGIDRSTVSQLLDPSSARLPNAQVAAECALALSVSADWLLGLTDRPELPEARLAEVLSLTDAARKCVGEESAASLRNNLPGMKSFLHAWPGESFF